MGPNLTCGFWHPLRPRRTRTGSVYASSSEERAASLAKRSSKNDWKVFALEINLRMGGTTHPYLALQFLTGGQLDAETGLFLSPRGMPKYYHATDNLNSAP